MSRKLFFDEAKLNKIILIYARKYKKIIIHKRRYTKPRENSIYNIINIDGKDGIEKEWFTLKKANGIR